ncbi:MAG: competence protein CoiA [Streptococcaceae bacterium]|jgi:competence protein CoiA|nr:competence protein CoiA [Streptococcaceae bacterium]
MLIAKTIQGELINCFKLPNQELKTMKQDSFFCPSCGEKVKLKIGIVRIPHFAHLSGSQCVAFCENESPEHLELKRIISDWSDEIKLEVYFPQLKQRPDALLNKICLEIQCSSLSIERLIERTNNYKRHGYQVLWLLGHKFSFKKRLSSLQRSFMNYSNACGFYLWFLDLESQTLILKYHISEDYLGNLFYHEQFFPFFQGDLSEILNYPQNGIFKQHLDFIPVDMLKKFHQKNWHGVSGRSEHYLKMQAHLYQERENLLQLPKYYYYPGLKPIFAKKDFLLWKLHLFQLLEGGVSLKEAIYQLFRVNLATYHMPNIRQADLFMDFIIEELLALKTLNLLIEKEKRFYLIKCKTRHLIPYEHDWQKIPKVSSQLPRKLC